MAQLPRAQLSVSSELQSMARMRAHARELSAKDAVWQEQLLAARVNNNNIPQPSHVPVPPLNTAAPALSPTPHSPNLCASPVSPGEMTNTAVPPLPLRGAIAKTSTTPRPKRGSGKIRRKRLTKEEEARFPVEELADLTGTTAARSRKMSREEHDLMLHKRRLRNRESAARSRDKQRRTTAELAAEVDVLSERTQQLTAACERAASAARHHAARADALARSNAALVAELAALRGTPRRPPLAVSAPQPISTPPISGSLPLNVAASAPLVTSTALTSVGLPASSLGSLSAPAPAPGISSDTLDRLLADPPLPPISRAPSLVRMPSWGSMRPEQSAVLRKQNSLLAFMDLDGSAPSLSQDIGSLLPQAAAPL